MDASAVKAGRKVRIRAADEFFAFIDGWEGFIDFPCWNMGTVVVICQRADGRKTFYVPADQLEQVGA